MLDSQFPNTDGSPNADTQERSRKRTWQATVKEIVVVEDAKELVAEAAVEGILLVRTSKKIVLLPGLALADIIEGLSEVLARKIKSSSTFGFLEDGTS